MGASPYPPGDPAAQLDPAEIDNGGAFADGRETAGIAVAKRPRCYIAAQAPLDRGGDMAALLFGGRCNSRHRLAMPRVDGRRIADGKDFRMSGNAEVRLHFDAVGAIGRRREPIGSDEACTPAAQRMTFAGNLRSPKTTPLSLHDSAGVMTDALWALLLGEDVTEKFPRREADEVRERDGLRRIFRGGQVMRVKFQGDYIMALPI